MLIEMLTLFPQMWNGFVQSSILDRAQKAGAVKIRLHQLRDYALDRHHIVDDRPFGGGPGMVLKCEPLVRAIETIQAMETERAWVIYLTPQGNVFTQNRAVELVQKERILFVSGHYEGIDERVRLGGWIDEEISIGDYVLTNGTLPAMVLTDCLVRLLPGVLGNEESAAQDSFGSEGCIEGPQYTRPEVFQGMGIPEVLLSGNHARIAEWRRQQAEERTIERRADLMQKRNKR